MKPSERRRRKPKAAVSWSNNYRPNDLAGMALDPELRQHFERYLAADVLPTHLILYGPPGFGKTTIATIIAKQLYGFRVMRVKATETGKVDYIRERVIGGFMRAMLGGSKLLIFEEASGLSRESQEALRVPLEDWSDLCQVIFLTNDVSKLDAAVRSRCTVIEMTRPPIPECARVLGGVLKDEGIKADPDDVLGFVRGYFAGHFATDDEDHDFRGLLRAAERAIATDGKLPAPPEIARSAALTLDAWQSPSDAGGMTDGAALLNDLADQFSKYLSLPAGGVEALALWTAFAWAHEAFSVSPILTLASPTMRAGKSTVFDVLEQLLIPGATFHPSNLTTAVVFRLKGLAEDDQAVPSPTPKPPSLCLLLDEADSWINLRDELRSVLNSGHTRRGAFVFRMIGTSEVGRFSSWYPKALALIDAAKSPLPATLRDRSIVVPMQRMKAGEARPKFPRHQAVPELSALAERTAYWVRDHFATLRDLGGGAILAADELNDRAKDNWHPLMVIAHVVGGGWEQRARKASLLLSDATRYTERLIDLLGDVRAVFDAEGTAAIRSVTLTEKLVALEDRQWKGLTPRQLSKMLRPLDIRPHQLWTARKQNKNGYERAHFEDAFARYLS